MSHDEFINKLQEAFAKQYNAVQISDIKKFLQDNNVGEERVGYLYEILTSDCTYLPRKREVKKAYEQSKSGFAGSGETGNLHPQSPYQQVVKHKDKPVEWLVRECQRIRLKQDREELFSWEISFIYYWEDLTRLPEKFREVGKRLIVENRIDESGRNKELDELIEEHMERVPLSQILVERKGRTVSMAEVMKEIRESLG